MTRSGWLSPGVLFAATLALVFSGGCACRPVPSTPDSGDPVVDAGPDPVEDTDAGMEPVDAGGDVDAGPPPVLTLKRLLPPRGSSAGGSNVIIEGSAFLRDFAGSGTQAKPLTTIKFGSNAVIDYQIIDDETLEARVPPGPAGTVSVSIKNPNGTFLCTGCFTYFDDLVVTGYSPREGALAGGNEVTIDGAGFTSDVQVLFGSFSSPSIALVSPKQLKVIVPRGVAPDLVDVTVYNKNGVSNQRRSYRYFADARVTTVAPLTGPIAGGTVVTLTGAGFTGATSVSFGNTPGTALSVTSDTELVVTSPATSSTGAVDLTVVTPRDQWVAKSAFTYFDSAGALAVFGAFPHVARPGNTVTVTGQGLDATGLSITLGGVDAVVGAKTFSTAVITVPARGAAPRVSAISVNDGATSASKAGAFTWRLKASAISPASGPSAGGTAATVTGTGLPSSAEVLVGTLAASAVAVTGEASVAFTTPAGSGGAGSDVVRDSADRENQDVLVGGFTYLEPLSVGRVQPDRGAIAGNTLVTVLGSGFGDSTVVSFGANRAKDVKVVDSHSLTCRTPKGAVGTVDVGVQRLTERDTLPGGYSYFDPRSISGGASGGPLVGTLNVTVLDSTQGSYGAPVPLVTVMLGIDPNTPFQGLTDAHGQVTFSDPSLVKAQTVTVYKEGYQSTTVTQVNSENLTVFVSRTGGGEGSPSSPPPGVPASTISGRVTGFKAPRVLAASEIMEARVFVAQTSLYGGPPFGGLPDKSKEKWRVTVDGGEYLVFTNAGLHAVYAVLGILNKSTQQFTPVTMGVARGVTTSADNPATNQNIILDMQLDLSVPITIDSPLSFQGPLGLEPGVNQVYAWLDLGAEGFVPNPNNWGTGMAQSSSVTSATGTLTFPNFPQLDGSNFIFLNQSASSANYPVSYYFRRQPGDMSLGVTIGPMLPAANVVEPSTSFNGTISWTIDPGAVPNLMNVQVLKPTLFGNVTLWNVVLPGTDTSVVLPPPAVQQLQTAEAGNQLFIVIYGSRSPKFSYNQWTYDTLSGVSWSSFTISVSPGFTP